MDEADTKVLHEARERLAAVIQEANATIQRMDRDAERLSHLHERLILVGVRVHPPTAGRLLVMTEEMRRLGREASDVLKALQRSYTVLADRTPRPE